MDEPLVIGVNAEVCRDKDGRLVSALDCGYCRAIAAAGASPIMLPPVADTIQHMLSRLNGIVLTGSHYDYDPRIDGFELHVTTRPMAEEREKFDRALAIAVRQAKLPVLGIGGGMQLLNCTCGGKTSLHIPDDWPKSLPHMDPLEPNLRHGIEMAPGSLVSQVWGQESPSVTSHHHQAVDIIPVGWIKTAWCQRIIEAIECLDSDWIAVGVQWHPESRYASPREAGLFAAWLDEIGHLRRTGRRPKRTITDANYMSRTDAAHYLGVARNTLNDWASRRFGPCYHLIGNKVYYRKTDLDAWNRGRGQS